MDTFKLRIWNTCINKGCIMYCSMCIFLHWWIVAFANFELLFTNCRCEILRHASYTKTKKEYICMVLEHKMNTTEIENLCFCRTFIYCNRTYNMKLTYSAYSECKSFWSIATVHFILACTCLSTWRDYCRSIISSHLVLISTH